MRAHVPGGFAYTVVPGMKPFVHVVPSSVVVAKPRLEDPPSENRPTWKVATTVEPKEAVSGSTSVWW